MPEDREYQQIEKYVKIAFPDESVYRVTVTPRVPEEEAFTGYGMTLKIPITG